MNDSIRLPRSALDIIGDKDLWQLYGYLLSKADENGIVDTTLATIQRDLKVNQKPLRTMLARLERANLGAKSGASKGSKITLCDIDNYTTQRASKRANPGAKEGASKKSTKFTPPTREEAQAYIDKMGFHWGDADLFIDFNEQKNWRLSDGKPMQDWRAAMRNWENRWKQKYKNGELKTNPTDKYAARRGTDVGNHTEADYGGPF